MEPELQFITIKELEDRFFFKDGIRIVFRARGSEQVLDNYNPEPVDPEETLLTFVKRKITHMMNISVADAQKLQEHSENGPEDSEYIFPLGDMEYDIIDGNGSTGPYHPYTKLKTIFDSYVR